MFFKKIRRNAGRNRKSNGLFFGSLVIAIIAFYTLLSLGEQDVMHFLKTIESDAVKKLLLLIPSVYIISLFFVFFLVYFAYRYQLDIRRKEFGLYLMLGMKRSRLFMMLMGETIWNSLLSLLIGMPIALLLTEGISLATAKLVGLGILGHKLSFSLEAVIGTVFGFMAVQMLSMLFLSAVMANKEPMELINSDAAKKQEPRSLRKGWFCLVAGMILLILAYVLGVTRLNGLDFKIVMVILLIGGGGTFLLFSGMGVFIGHYIRRKAPKKTGLFTFTGRQIQESVVYQHRALAVSSLLLLMALSCISVGIGVAIGQTSSTDRSADASVLGSEQRVRRTMNSESIQPLISAYYPMLLGTMNTDLLDDTGKVLESKEDSHEVSWDGLKEVILNQPESEYREYLLRELVRLSTYPYIISESSYNALLQSIGKEPVTLDGNKIALYTMKNSVSADVLNVALKSGAYVTIDGEAYDLLPKAYTENVVSDRKITLLNALIVPDACYEKWRDGDMEPFCWNVVLKPEIVKEKGLMQSIQQLDQELEGSGLVYESYLSGIGRTLFYTVAASYLTIYLGILFVIIANTVIGLKYLMQQRANQGRYLTLLMLGADANGLCKSAKVQIRLFFAFVLGVAMCSSVFAIWAMFNSFIVLPAGTSLLRVVLLAGIAFFLFVVIEFIYICIIERTSSREIRALRVTDRGK